MPQLHKCKRCCIIELPKCQRCRQRNLDCVYDLEPLLTRNGSKSPGEAGYRNSHALPVFSSSKRNMNLNDAAARGFLEYISSLHMSEKMQAFSSCRSRSFTGSLSASTRLARAWTAIPITTDPEDTSYVISELLRIPALVREGRSTPFVHPQLHRTATSRGFQVLDAPAQDPDFTSGHFFDELLALDAHTIPLQELVAATQVLIMFLIQHALDDRSAARPIDLVFKLLVKWRAILWTSATSRMPQRSLTPWQSWVLAESVRRTILMSYLLEGTYSARKNGWCCHQLFVEALPFSAQGRLWLAGTPEEWSALANDDMAGAAPPAARKLVSFQELTGGFARAPFEVGDDFFQRLLLVSHHGKRSVEDRLARCQISMSMY
jgi:hypothetical protein